MSWFKRESGKYESGAAGAGRLASEAAEKRVRTEGLWIKCLGCRAVVWKADLEANLNVCPNASTTSILALAGESACCSNPAMNLWTAAYAPPTP